MTDAERMVALLEHLAFWQVELKRRQDIVLAALESQEDAERAVLQLRAQFEAIATE